MKVTIWDVQHGSAAWIRTPNNTDIVVDLGVGDQTAGSANFSPLLQLRREGVGRIDQLILTHPHRDHLDDIANVASQDPRILKRPRHLTAGEIRAGNRANDNGIVDAYLALDAKYSAPVDPSENPESEVLNGGVTVETYHPILCSRSNLNDHSIVSFFSFAGITLCIPGDNEAASWRELLDMPGFPEALSSTDVFVASHHGRESGYCEELASHLSPKLVIVSDGPETPTSAVAKYTALARGWRVYSRSGAAEEVRKVLTTRFDGTIVIECGLTAGGNYLHVTRE